MTKIEELEALLGNSLYFGSKRESSRMDKPVYGNLCGEENKNQSL